MVRLDLSHRCQTDVGEDKGNPGSPRFPPSVLAPESALGSVPTVALSSAQVDVVVRWTSWAGQFLQTVIDGKRFIKFAVKTPSEFGNIFG
jgi:hypothetical protein